MNDRDRDARRRALRRLEADVRAHPEQDSIHVFRAHLYGSPPGQYIYAAGRWSLIARLTSDQRESSEYGADEVIDLGPHALAVIAREARPSAFAAGELIICGVAQGRRWLRWMLPGPPPEPPP